MGCVGSRIFPSSDSSSEKAPREKNPKVLIGDVTTKKESKAEREMKIKEKQLLRTSKAEEMSGKILEEKERLSLGTRSRGTSRATSRAGSPTPNSRKQVHFKPDEIKLMKSSMDSNSSNQSGFLPSEKRPGKSSLKNQNGNGTQLLVVKTTNSESDVTEADKAQKNQSENVSQNGNSNMSKKENEMTNVPQVNETGLRGDKLSTIDERTNSRCSNKSEDVKKG